MIAKMKEKFGWLNTPAGYIILGAMLVTGVWKGIPAASGLLASAPVPSASADVAALAAETRRLSDDSIRHEERLKQLEASFKSIDGKLDKILERRYASVFKPGAQ